MKMSRNVGKKRKIPEQVVKQTLKVKHVRTRLAPSMRSNTVHPRACVSQSTEG